MFSNQEAQGVSTSDEEEYRALKMALLIQELLADDKGTWISASYSTAPLPGSRACDGSSDTSANPSSSFPLTYSYTLPDKYIESLANLDNQDQYLSVIDIESESDTEELARKSVSFRKHLVTNTKDSCTQTQCTFKNDQSSTNFERYADLRYDNLNKKSINTSNVTFETDEIRTLFSPLDLSPSLDSDSEITIEDLEVKVTKPTKRNNFVSEPSSSDSQTSSAKTDVAAANLKPGHSDSTKTSDMDSFCRNILPASTTTTTTTTSSSSARNACTKLPPGRESQSSYNRDAEQNSDSEFLNKSKSVSSSSSGKIKSPRPGFSSEVSAIPTQIFMNPSNQTVNKNLLQLISQDRRKTRKICVSFSENWNTSHKDAQGISKVTNSIDQPLRKKLNAHNTNPKVKPQSIQHIKYKNENNFACRSSPPKYSSTSKTSNSSTNSFHDIFLAKNPSVLLNNSNNRQRAGKRSGTPLPWMHKEKQKNYLQISSRKRKRKAAVSKEKPKHVYFLKGFSKMSIEESHPQPSVSNNEVTILMPAKPGRMENSETSSSLLSQLPLETQTTQQHTLLHRLCSVVCKCCCIRRK